MWESWEVGKLRDETEGWEGEGAGREAMQILSRAEKKKRRAG